MGEWKKTTCTLCACACGLEVQVENNRIVRVRGDKSSDKTHGYVCRKGRSIKYFQHNADRVLYPLKRVGDQYQRISWEQAITEICGRLKPILEEHGPKAFACQGLGGFYGSMHTVMAKNFMAAVGSQQHFRALAAELTGVYWSNGVIMGNQGYVLHGDEANCEVLVVSGWNPYVTHNMIEGKRVIHDFATEPDKTLIVIDPRRSETARMADIHLAIRPGTDAVLWRAMVALVLQEGWQNPDYIDAHISDLEKVLPWFEGVDVKEYCAFCGLDYEDVRKVAYLMAKKRSSFHSDLGVICGRHSTLTTHLQHIFLAICGRLLVPGGDAPTFGLIPMAHTPVDDPKFWRTNVTDIPQIIGLMPTAVLAEEIDNDDPNRVRALFCVNSNPIHSIVDTPRTIKALKKLDLLVVMDCNFTETARMADYILPNTTGYECYEINPNTMTYPAIFAQLRAPVLQPEGEILDGAEIWLRLMEKMGFIPEIPNFLYQAAEGDRREYKRVLNQYLEANPEAAKRRVPIVAKTLGRAMGSISMAVLWNVMQNQRPLLRKWAVPAGYPEGPDQMEQVFDDLLTHPEGVVLGYMDTEHLFDIVQTTDGKLHLYASELEDWVREITPEQEAKVLYPPEFSMVLHAGRHIEANINHTMRNPDWIKGKENPCVISLNPADGLRLGIQDGSMARVTTEVGSVELPVRLARDIREGTCIIPHGFGFTYDNVTTGFNINWLTSAKNRDRFVGTPYHRHVPCRVEAVGTEKKG